MRNEQQTSSQPLKIVRKNSVRCLFCRAPVGLLRGKRYRAFFSLLLFVFVASVVDAQDPPSGGTALIPTDKPAVDQVEVRLGAGKFGRHTIVETQRADFARSLQIELVKRPENTWDAAFGLPIATPVAKDDVLLVSFWMRGKANNGVGGAVAELVFERFGEPYTKSVQYLAETPSDGSWQHYWVRFRSLEDYDVGEAGLNFQLGYQEESLELAGLTAWNYGKDVDVETLPNTELTYAGRSPDATWRNEATERIDRIRKTDVRLKLLGDDGKPLASTPVSIRLNRHAFGFGSAVSVSMLTGDGEDNDRYRETFQKYFNIAVIENGLKWGQWDNGADERASALEALRWLQQRRIPARGHVMVWPSKKNSPDWVGPIADHPESLLHLIDTHIRDVGRATQGLVRDWDVLNEVFDNSEFVETLGDEAMVGWFKTAAEVLPGVDLYYNDYAGLVRGGFPTVHKDHFEKTVRYLTDNGAPIEGIGIQAHFGSLLTPPERLLAELDRWQALGLKVLITEFDVTVPGKKLQAEFARDFLTVCFSHPAVDGILTWGFWEDAHWRPDAALFAKDWSMTPTGKEWVRLTTETWSTDQELRTNNAGEIAFRGFIGEYTVDVQGQSRKMTVDRAGNVQWLDAVPR